MAKKKKTGAQVLMEQIARQSAPQRPGVSVDTQALTEQINRFARAKGLVKPRAEIPREAPKETPISFTPLGKLPAPVAREGEQPKLAGPEFSFVIDKIVDISKKRGARFTEEGGKRLNEFIAQTGPQLGQFSPTSKQRKEIEKTFKDRQQAELYGFISQALSPRHKEAERAFNITYQPLTEDVAGLAEFTDTRAHQFLKEGASSVVTLGYGYEPGLYIEGSPRSTKESFAHGLGVVVGLLPSILGGEAAFAKLGAATGVSQVLSRAPRFVQVAANILKQGLVFGSVEGLSKVREGETRGEKFLTGFGTGVFFGTAGAALSPFGKLVNFAGHGGAGYAFAKFTGAPEQDARAQGLLFGVLGAIGAGRVPPKAIKKIEKFSDLVKAEKKTGAKGIQAEILALEKLAKEMNVDTSFKKGKEAVGVAKKNKLSPTEAAEVLSGPVTPGRELVPRDPLTAIKEAAKTREEAGVPSQSFLKALESATREKPVGPVIRVSDLAKVAEDRLSKITPPKTVLPKGRKRIDLFKPTEKPSEIAKVKPKGAGEIRVTVKDLDMMRKIEDLRGILLQTENPLRVFEKMGPEMKRKIFDPMRDAEGRYQKAFEVFKKRNNKFIKDTLGKKSGKMGKRIGIASVAEEAGGMEILSSRGITPVKLTPKEKVVMEGFRSVYKDTLQKINKVRRLIGKEPIPERVNYFPHVRELNALEEMGVNLFMDVQKAGAKGVHKLAPSYGFEKKRLGSNKIQLDAFIAIEQYMNSSLRFINLAPEIAKSRFLIGSNVIDPRTGEKFSFQESKPGAHGYIQEWLDFISGTSPGTIFDKFAAQALNKLAKNISVSSLAFNAASAIIQPTALVGTAAEIGPYWTLRGVNNLMKGEGKMAFDKSNVLVGRLFDVELSSPSKVKKAKEKIGDFGFVPLRYLDSKTATATWLGAYKKALRGGKKEAEAIRFADDTVIRTQGSGSPLDVAPLQRSALGKSLTMFQTFVINNFNFVKRDVLGLGNKNISTWEATKKTADYIIGATLVNVLYEDVLGLPSPFPRPIKAYLDEGTGAATKEALSFLPGPLGGLKFRSESPFGAAGDVLVDLWQDIQSGEASIDQVENFARIYGVPGVSQIKKTLKGVDAIEDGYVVYARDPDGKLVKMKIPVKENIDQVMALLFGPYGTSIAEDVRERLRKGSSIHNIAKDLLTD